MEKDSVSATRFAHALLVGTDEVLLYTRQQILEKEGFRVFTVEPCRVTETLKIACPDVIIACHTLSTEEAEALVEAARAHPHRPALISFTKELSPAPTKPAFDETVWSFAHPESFISKVFEVLRPRPL